MKRETWDQLKNITVDTLIAAIHYHPHKAYGPDLLRDILRDIGWTENDLKRLKLTK
jgi:hypothetical protein